MFAKALSKLFSKMKGAPPKEVGEITSYQTDVCNEPLQICMIVALMIFFANLMRQSRETTQKHVRNISPYEIQTQIPITEKVKLNLYIFK
jgi:hypothetical protein